MRGVLAAAVLSIGCGAPQVAPGEELWTRTWEPAGEDLGLDVAAAAERVVAVGARERDGADDAWVVALDRDGDEVWSQTLDRGGDELAAGVALAADGSIAIAGALAPMGATWDAWLVGLDDAGTGAWEGAVAGSVGGEDQAVAIAIAPDGSPIAVGYETASDGGTAAWIAGLAPDGTPLWAQLHEGPGTGFDVATGVAWSPAADVAWVVGYETSARGDTDVWTSTWRGDGTMVWARAIDVELGDDRATAVAVAPDGGAWVSGVATVPGHTVDAWAAELDTGGAIVWSRLHDGPASLGDGANGVAASPDGDAVVVAGYEYVDGEAWNTWVRALDRDGDELWTHRFVASDADDVAADVAVDDDGAIFLVGSAATAPERRTAYVRRLAP